MGTGLFDSPPRPSAHDRSDAAADGYRALSGAAIAAVTLALLSPLAFLGWWLAAVPAVGLAVAILALVDIARRPAELTGRPAALAAAALSSLLLVGSLAYHATVYAAELPAGFTRLDYTMLQPERGDPPDTIPATARDMDGRDALLKGFMYPGKERRGITLFLLVRDQGDCCFGGNPKISDRVLVRMADPRGIDFTQRLVKIAGRFRVQPAGAPDSGGGVLYQMEDARAR
jgi:hypothetical protein